MTEEVRSDVVERNDAELADRPVDENMQPIAGTQGKEEPGAESTLLFRHPKDRMLGGVCGGLAAFLGLDSNLVRILWIILTFGTAGGGFLAYGALWLLLPVGTANGGTQRTARLGLNDRNLWWAGAVLMGMGVLWLLANLGVLPALWSAFWSVLGLIFWPAVLIGVGLLLLRGARDTSGWRSTIRTSLETVRERFTVNRIDREQIKRGMKGAQQRIPLKRSRSERLFLGVCGGIGRSLHIDPNLIRLIWAAFSIGSFGMGVLVYVLVALLLPEEPAGAPSRYHEDVQDIQVVEGKINHSVQV
jgi:phage shock protein PspC (stress-responsive transcriptional regulator)